jgi:hypothetical protein
VIDSGVHAAHPHVGAVSGGIAIGSDGESGDFSDNLGHGTAVLAAIKERAPEANYFAVKIYFRKLQTNIDALVRALQWSLENRIDVVNLSLGTANPEHRQILLPLLEHAGRARMSVVAAALMGTECALPGSLPGVFGVIADTNLERNVFRREVDGTGVVRWAAAPFPRSIPGVPKERNLQGISFAVANLSGIVLRAAELTPDRSFEKISALMAAESERLVVVEAGTLSSDESSPQE